MRGTPFDIFGYTTDGKLERRLIEDYEHTLETLLAGLDHDNHAYAVEIAALPQKIRGFGPVKEAASEQVEARKLQLLESFRNPPSETAVA